MPAQNLLASLAGKIYRRRGRGEGVKPERTKGTTGGAIGGSMATSRDDDKDRRFCR